MVKCVSRPVHRPTRKETRLKQLVRSRRHRLLPWWPAIPTLLRPEELGFLYWLTRTTWSGQHDLLEIGSWLGGSTWCLAKGMDANPRRRDGAVLHVVDNFTWRPFMAERAPFDLPAGASFRPQFDDYLAPLRHLLVVHEASLPDDTSADVRFPEPTRDDSRGLPLFSASLLPQPVELVVVDGAKSWLSQRHLLAELAPRTLPGATRIVFQDYPDWSAFWVPMMLEWIEQEAPGTLVPEPIASRFPITFRLARSLDAEVVGRLPETVDGIPVEKGLQLLDLARRRYRKMARVRAGVDLAAVPFLGTMGDWDRAVERFQRVEARWPVTLVPNALGEAREMLQRWTGRAPPEAPRTAQIAALHRTARPGVLGLRALRALAGRNDPKLTPAVAAG
jgi:hypothetical protein